MSDTIATVLIVALAFDAIANVARMVSVEIQYKRQAKLINAQKMETDERIEAATDVIESTVKATLTAIFAESAKGGGS